MAAFIVPFIVYFMTLCRTIYWGDGIELTTAAHVLGVPHPTGYPLFMLLGRLAMLIVPFGEPAMRMNLMCAGFGAGAVLMMYLLLRCVLMGWMAEAIGSERTGALVAIGGAMVFAFSRSQWFHAVTTEVYTLHIMLVMAMFYLFVRWQQERREALLLWLTGASALALSHHTMAVFAAPLPVLAWIQWSLKNQKGAPSEKSAKFLGIAALLFILPFLLYLYLPLRAAAKPEINWGHPATLDEFVWVVTGGDFRSQLYMKFDPVTPFTSENYPVFFEQRLRGLIDVAGNDFLMLFDEARVAKLLIFLAVAAFSLFGILYLSKVDKLTALGWCLYLAGTIFFVFTYNVTDFGAFYYPLWALAWPAAVIGGWMLVSQFWAVKGVHNARPVALLLLFLAAGTLTLNVPFCNKSAYRGAIEYAHRILDAVEPGAMIVTIEDNDIYPLWYAQIVEKRRPDAIVVGSNFISSGWYESFFTAEEKARWALPIEQRDLMYYDQFYDLIVNRLIKPNLARGPVYTTFFDNKLAQNFRLEFVSASTISDTDPALLDSFLPKPFLIRLFPLETPTQ